MNRKRLFALCVSLILMTVVVGAVFAEEREYTVTVSYRLSTSSGGGGAYSSVTYTVWAASASDAQQAATAKCQFDMGNAVSCGGAIATGRTR